MTIVLQQFGKLSKNNIFIIPNQPTTFPNCTICIFAAFWIFTALRLNLYVQKQFSILPLRVNALFHYKVYFQLN